MKTDMVSITLLINSTTTIQSIIHDEFSFTNILLFCRSAYHSAMMENTLPAKSITALLPLFREHANTPAMIHHAMLLIKKQTAFLSPGKQTNDLFHVIDTLVLEQS